MTYFSKEKPEVMQRQIDQINTRWAQLYELEKEWAERALKFLLFSNSGGAIATLSFLGAAPKAIDLVGAKIALFLFVCGVFLVGVVTAKTFHSMSGVFQGWRIDTENFYKDGLTWEEINKRDESRAANDCWDYVIPYASFICFFVGCVAGAVALFTGTSV